MDTHVYKQIELTGTSSKSIEDAIQTAVAVASQSVRHLCWFEVLQTRGAIKEGKVSEWQVMLKVGFKIEK